MFLLGGELGESLCWHVFDVVVKFDEVVGIYSGEKCFRDSFAMPMWFFSIETDIQPRQ
jgi:hypothetical protein